MTDPIPDALKGWLKMAPLCDKGTRRGEVAENSRYGWAPCTLPEGHHEPCNSGPLPQPPKAA